MTLRRETLSLYKQFMKLGKQWPGDSKRPGRTLKEKIILNVRHDFQKHRHEADTKVVKSLLESGYKNLNYLKELHEGKYEHMVRFFFCKSNLHFQYPRTETIFPAITYQANEYLATKTQDKVTGRSEKPTRKFFSNFFGSDQKKSS
jgi:hypothetical protein